MRLIPHFEFTEEFIIIKVLIKITIKHKTMMKCEVKSRGWVRCFFIIIIIISVPSWVVHIALCYIDLVKAETFSFPS